MTSDTTPSIGRQGQRPAGRPPLPPGAGINQMKLDLEVTRDELASTLDDLFATFNIRVQIRSHPVVFVGVFLTMVGAAAGIATLLLRRRGRAR
ncbi:hypothetical protein [Leifsonia shinshuensis]|uniref:hypothetical protein n=1 Tax=Leifsonia shinshuensis TaxID=150026 RepID=UPI0028581F98|nr:hypothetical protein [Leifsonia shinshuensis]MDR6972405.1 hypothetical protein [Leifsonia shinshuensis]